LLAARENIEGRDIGSTVSLIFEDTGEIGTGPRLHKHPYAETFVIISGRVRFTIGERTVEGAGGDTLVAPAQTPHKFEVLEPYKAVHIHENDHFITDWLE
jgi:quercetin dioxygenase-like cupin family protein